MIIIIFWIYKGNVADDGERESFLAAYAILLFLLLALAGGPGVDWIHPRHR